MNLRCYVIDDEAHAVDYLRELIFRTAGLELAGTATRPLEALETINRLKPEVCFIDVDMPQLSGLELAVRLPAGTRVVFTTAFREYGPEAFEYEAVDYLLKPFTYERFLKTVTRLQNSRPAARTLAVKSGGKGILRQIPLDEIRYVSGLAAYVEIHLASGRVVTQHTLTALLSELPAAEFSRIHKSYIIRDAALTCILGNQVCLRDGTCLPLGRLYRQAFRQKIRAKR